MVCHAELQQGPGKVRRTEALPMADVHNAAASTATEAAAVPSPTSAHTGHPAEPWLQPWHTPATAASEGLAAVQVGDVSHPSHAAHPALGLAPAEMAHNDHLTQHGAIQQGASSPSDGQGLGTVRLLHAPSSSHDAAVSTAAGEGSMPGPDRTHPVLSASQHAPAQRDAVEQRASRHLQSLVPASMLDQQALPTTAAHGSPVLEPGAMHPGRATPHVRPMGGLSGLCRGQARMPCPYGSATQQ